ncbi:YlmH family RNA-binding protein [Streptococcus porcinus]|uniref:RNA-binding protein ylmH n=2 Tax=Streptococcus porcinus TaxID=1340 RepID=A0A4V0H057_STRPO|nr:RNA-binding protein [Streptococcus porcinus]EGJ26930.1 S4 domain protein [Streptococcus porcinus str. Jelinkova 176]SQG43240.1 RNA-binding protein ylmH [Streptococcus porcinus]VTT42350.1 RNA-binding protein ylmH [Streptococcus porcinus]VTT43809.1 RNA-binding protein ylmH [Streptococcus porcinus]
MTTKDFKQHFHPSETPFIEKIQDIIRRVEDSYSFYLTEFLNPRQVEILKILVASSDLQCFSSSDFYHTEYGRVIIAPDYYHLNECDFALAIVDISYNAKFNTIKHAQILGAFIHELGIQRSLLGDILVAPGHAQVMTTKSMLSYAITNISKIARASVNLKEGSLEDLIQANVDEKHLELLLSSFRLDTLIANVFKLSRSQAIKLVESEKVKINYRVSRKASDLLVIGDLISVRGFGRFQLLQDNGLTKNGKYKLTISKTMQK